MSTGNKRGKHREPDADTAVDPQLTHPPEDPPMAVPLTQYGAKLQSNGGGGGIGRRRGLKIPCPKGRVGSTPTRPI